MPLKIRIKKNPPNESVEMAEHCGVENHREGYDLEGRFKTWEGGYGVRDIVPSQALNAVFPFEFFYALSVGKKEAANLLADCVGENVGIKKSTPEDKVNFFIDFFFVLGKKLGDEACAKVLDGETIDDQRVEPCATACAKLIRKNVAELSGTTYYMKDVIARAIRLDGEIQKHSGGESFFKWTIHNCSEYLVALAYEVIDDGEIYSLPNETITTVSGMETPEVAQQEKIPTVGCTCEIM